MNRIEPQCTDVLMTTQNKNIFLEVFYRSKKHSPLDFDYNAIN